MNEKNKQMSREMSHTHVYHILFPGLFILVWTLDSNFFELTTWLNSFIPFEIRLILFITFFILAIIFIQLAHKILFKDNEPSEVLLTRGILAHTRNPMYFGILLVYVGFLCLSISLISLIVFLIVFLGYNKMVNFEENKLEEIFGEEYLEYKKKVPKWIPSLRSKI